MGLFIFASCTKHYDWRVETYMVGIVKNKSSRDVSITFCNESPALNSEKETIPADGKEYASAKLIDFYIDHTFDRPQNYIPKNYRYFQFATLSGQNSSFAKICTNESYRRTYMIIDVVDQCPDGYEYFNQYQAMCF